VEVTELDKEDIRDELALAILRRQQIRANVYEGLRRGLVENPLTFYQLERLEFHIERLKGLLGGSE
jgi:hypothetical protein